MSADSALTDGALSARGVIHDRGYRHYDGPRLGRVQIVRALLWHSFRSALGIGRGPKAKILPVIAFVAICLPAIVNAVAVARGNPQLVTYQSYSFPLRVIVLTIFVAAQAPELVSRDLRSRVLPLYFSRPMRRGDYPLAKYLAFTGACLLLVELPIVLLYLGTIASSKSNAIWPNTRGLLAGLAIGLMWAVLVAAIGLALASLSGRRAYATGVVAIYFFLTFTLGEIIHQVAQRGPQIVQRGPAGPLITPQTLPAGQRLSGLISPFTTLESITKWFAGQSSAFNPQAGPVSDPGSYATAYIVMFVVLLAASFAILAARYRKAGVA
jgi:ABC-2 type transport system permease protein